MQQFLQNVVDNMSEEEAQERNLLIEGNGLEMRHPQQLRPVQRSRRRNYEVVVDDEDSSHNNEFFNFSYTGQQLRSDARQQRQQRLRNENSESAYGAYGLLSNDNDNDSSHNERLEDSRHGLLQL